MAERLYSMQQTAELLGTSPGQVRRWVEAGALPAEDRGGEPRVSERGLVRFLTERGIDLGEILNAALADAPPADAGRDGTGEPPATRMPPRSDRPPTERPEASRRPDAATRLAEAILRDALRRQADAVFLEPIPGGLTLKLRVDGRVREKPRFASHLPTGLGPRLLARFRAMARLGEETDHPAVFAVRLDGRMRSFRLEAWSMPHGEGLVLYPVAPS